MSGQTKISNEGITNPSPAVKLVTEDSGRVYRFMTHKPAGINFRKMFVYSPLNLYNDTAVIDTTRTRIAQILSFDPEKNTLTDVYLYPSLIQESHTTEHSFQASGKVSQISVLHTKDNRTEVELNETIQYDKHGHVVDTLFYLYDSLGRVAHYRPFKGWGPWHHVFYRSSADTLPWLKTCLSDSTFFYYQGNVLIKKVSVERLEYDRQQTTNIKVWQFTYTKEGLPAEEIIYDNKYTNNSMRRKYTYNERGLLTKIVSYYLYTDVSFSESTFEYDKNDLLIKREIKGSPYFKERIELTYFSYDHMKNIVQIDQRVRRGYSYDRIVYRYAYHY